MRHQMAHRKLGRTSSHRAAMFRNQLASMIQSERIVTTLIKAKELRPLVEKLVTLGKKGSVHDRRNAGRTVSDDLLVKKLFEEIAPRFAERNGGYTRIIKLGPRRGDSAEMAILEFVDFEGTATPVVETKGKKAVPAKKKGESAAEGGEEKKAAAKKSAPKKSAPKKSAPKKGAEASEEKPKRSRKKKEEAEQA